MSSVKSRSRSFSAQADNLGTKCTRLSNTDCRHKMENKLPLSAKIEQPETCVSQEIHSWSPGSPYHSIQEHSQKWPCDSIDMKVVKQELSDFPCEDRSHRFSKMVDIAGGSIIQEMTKYHNSESRMLENSCKALVKHENCCQMSENVMSSLVDTNNELSLAIENYQQQNKETQEKHTQSFAKHFDGIFDYVSYSSQRTRTEDLSDVSSPNVCIDKYKRTHTEGMPNKCNEWDDVLIQDGHLECQKNMNNQRAHTGEKPYKCNDCGASFTQSSTLKRHKRSHAREKPYKCDDCGASFSHVRNIKTHMRIHTGERPYKCDVCGASFTQSSTLKGHKRSHTREKPYKCDDCGASFSHVGHMKTHKRIHTGEKPYKCDVCGASFSHVCNMNKHKRKHTGEKPYKCDYCGSSFTYASSLKYHKTTHSGEKPYKCDVCDASFTHTSSLKYHMTTHTGEQPYKCGVCGASFTHAGSLKTHKRIHIGERHYKCDGCDASCTQTCNLKKHMRLHHHVPCQLP